MCYDFLDLIFRYFDNSENWYVNYGLVSLEFKELVVDYWVEGGCGRKRCGW